VIRLQKVLADRGVASRRRAEELIVAGRVRVNGQVVTTLGTKVEAGARIDVDDVPTRAAAPRYIALNKPKGIVSTASDERGRKTVVDLVGVEERLYPVGRLDAESEGLILLTNDGEWAERVLHPRYGHEREYEVTVFGELTSVGIDELRRGVPLEEGLARAERVDVLTRSRNASRLRVVLRTGWKRQLRRMLASIDLRTERLVRVRIGSLVLGRLKIGDWRELNPKEIADLARPAARPAPREALLPAAAPKPSLRRAPRRSAATGSQGAGAPRRVATPRGPSAQRLAPRSGRDAAPPRRLAAGFRSRRDAAERPERFAAARPERPQRRERPQTSRSFAPRGPAPRPIARSGRRLVRPALARRPRAPRAFGR
jgi:pseudouridine synthase